MNPFSGATGFLRVAPQGRSKLLQRYEDDSGDVAAGGVNARLR